MSLLKSIMHGKEYRRLKTIKEIYFADRISDNKLFNRFKRQLPTQMQLCEWLGLNYYGKRARRYKL